MKALYKTADGRIQFEVTGETPKAIFEHIAGVQELFECETSCGVCFSKEGKGIRFRVRNAETHDGKKVKYYELLCLQCFARFQFGQAQEGGGLFPKRTEGEGRDRKPLPNRGWAKYEKPKPPETKPPNGAPARAEQPRPPRSAPPDLGKYDNAGYSAGITDDDVPF